MSTIPPLSTPALQRIDAYVALLRAWAPRLDLIAPGDLDRIEERHVRDSLRALPLVTDAADGSCVDVGSGAGFPGVPLAIASGRPWRLLEPRQRRAAFLEKVVRELDITAEVLAVGAKEAAGDPSLREHVLATARALATPPRALELCRGLVKPGGAVVLWVGKRAEFPPEAEETAEGLASIRIETP